MKSICECVSHQGDVPVSRTQHLQDHLDLLEGRVTCILVLLTLHPQCARVDVGSCAQAKVLLLVNTAGSREKQHITLNIYIQNPNYTYHKSGGFCMVSGAKSKLFTKSD